MNGIGRVPATLFQLRGVSRRETYCYCRQHMHSNGLVILNSTNASAVITSVERALALCSDTVFIDLRQIPSCGAGIMDVIGTLYGSVAGIAPRRNVVPLLQNQYADGVLAANLEYDRVFEVSHETSKTLQVLSYQRGERRAALKSSWPICNPKFDLVLRPTAVLPPQESQKAPFTNVALGGTFDRLHAGHRLLLAAAAAITSGNLYVGVTDDKLLAGKQYQELIHNYDDRVFHVRTFLKHMCPELDPVIMRLDDPGKPTRAETEKDIEALVVSEETLKGGVRINEGRAGAGFPPLVLFVVPVLGAMSGGEKLSSTSLRQVDAEALQHSA